MPRLKMSGTRHICRLCSATKDEADFDCVLNQVEAEGGINFSDYVNFYCRITLNPSPLLPRKVCKLCRLTVETFITFCDNLSKVEKTIIAINPKLGEFSEAPVKTETIKKEEDSVAPLFEPSTCITAKSGRPRTSMQHIKKLYEAALEKDSFALTEYAHITVDREFVSDEGHISESWLNQFDVQTWNNFSFKCFFCSEHCGSLKVLLNHLKDCKCACGKIKFSCHECTTDVKAPFSSLNAYVNHSVRYHELEHLAYTCIDCCKSFYNIAFLIKHIGKEHPLHPIIYPCIECGAYCQGLTALKTHTMSHKSQEVSDSSDDEDNGPSASSTPKVAKKRQASGEPPKKRVKTFPCGQCERTLLTKRGYDYHILIHSNSKPFKCTRCAAAYRSKQDLDKHILKHQLNRI